MTRSKPKREASREFAAAHDWRTTDAEAVERRRQRATEAKFVIENTDARHPVFSMFRVKSDTGQTYSVEVRGAGAGKSAERFAAEAS